MNQLMTPNVEVTHPGATLQEAAQQMKRLNVGALPVCEADRLVGMITDRDLTVRATAAGSDPTKARVGQVMTPQVITCGEEENVMHAGAIMDRHQIRRLPILSRSGQLVGIFTLGDLAVRAAQEELAGQMELAGLVLQHISTPSEPQR